MREEEILMVGRELLLWRERIEERGCMNANGGEKELEMLTRVQISKRKDEEEEKIKRE
jgi:hypothetical protein